MQKTTGKGFLAMWPFLLAVVVAMYLLPLFIQDTGSGMVILLIVLPIVCLASALLYGWRHAFHILFTILVALLFLPTILLYYNASAWVYAPAYGVLAAIGNGIGALLGKK